MQSTYSSDDVKLLLTDLTGQVPPMSVEERHQAVLSGQHYSELLPEEFLPSQEHLQEFMFLLNVYIPSLANDIAVLATKILDRVDDPILVSIPRAGLPIGVLLKRYMETQLHHYPHHYAVSVIKDYGVDEIALDQIYMENHDAAQRIIYVDGWTGSGSIRNELPKNSQFACIANPAFVGAIDVTVYDRFVLSAMMNGIISGCISRTIKTTAGYHGAVFYEHLLDSDMTQQFLSSIEEHFTSPIYVVEKVAEYHNPLGHIMSHYQYSDPSKIKLGINETVRMILRRKPALVLVKDSIPEPLGFLCKTRNIPIEFFDLGHYSAAGLIRKD